MEECDQTLPRWACHHSSPSTTLLKSTELNFCREVRVGSLFRSFKDRPLIVCVCGGGGLKREVQYSKLGDVVNGTK
jgi:hypothetical protein